MSSEMSNDVPAAQPWRWWGWATLRWIIDKRAVSPWYLIRYVRFLRVVVFTRGVTFTGPVFLGRGARFEVRHRVGRVIVGRWVHLGSGTVVRCHEGTLRIGDKCVFGQNNTINCHLDVEIGEECIVADSVYVGDFDHRMDVTDVPIRSQGLVKSPVIIGPDVWLGVKSTILRGSVVGRGCVVGAHALVRGDVPSGRLHNTESMCMHTHADAAPPVGKCTLSRYRPPQATLSRTVHLHTHTPADPGR